jgi:hypothetical protein
MKKSISILFLAAYLAAAVSGDDAKTAAVPVLVELFTAEGCSSCPPADEWLLQMDKVQPLAGAQLIVLSEHVDYWDHDGWKDSHSSKLFTDRQEDYDRRFGLKTTFTPQMVVDGAAQMNGSNGPLVARAIEGSVSRARIPVRISSVSVANEKTLRVHLEVDALPADFKTRKAEIFVAIALNHAQSHVSGGENKGRDISHVAVAESIDKVGTVDKAKNFDRKVQVKVKSADLANLRLIAFVQEPDAGQIVGASLVAPPIH